MFVGFRLFDTWVCSKVMKPSRRLAAAEGALVITMILCCFYKFSSHPTASESQSPSPVAHATPELHVILCSCTACISFDMFNFSSKATALESVKTAVLCNPCNNQFLLMAFLNLLPPRDIFLLSKKPHEIQHFLLARVVCTKLNRCRRIIDDDE